VPITRADTARARELAANVRRKAAAGAPFDSLARVFSNDPVTADSGGLLGDFAIEALTPPFDTVVARLDSGAISEPVKSDHGFHVVKVLDRQDERMMSYLEMQDDIRSYLYNQKFAERIADYVERVRKKIFVKRYR
jgi:parvulin-like peptidyl-prolyl isomerase